MTLVASPKPPRWDGLVDGLVRARVVAEIALWRCGWIWAVVVVLLAAAGGTALFARGSLELEGSRLRQRAALVADLERDEAQRSVAGSKAGGAGDAGVDTNAQRQAILASVLVSRDQASEEVRLIYALATRQQVAVLQAEFQNNADVTGIERLQINIPTKASYPQLRRFLEACLREMPNASLDRLSYKRSQVGEAQIEARVYLSLWLRAAGGGAMPNPAGPLQSAEARP